MNYRQEHVKCNVCGSDDVDFISDKGDFELPVNLVLCKTCGLAYLNPRWNKAAYVEFYQKEYDKYYRPKLLTNNDKPLATKNYTIVERLRACGIEAINPQTILDIGSGEGHNLLSFRDAFSDSELYAIEPSESSQKKLKDKGITILSDDIDKAWDENYRNYFDLIVMQHVLEHFLNPAAVLHKAFQALKDDGILYIAVPNNLKAERSKGWLRVPHVYYFNKYSLKNLLIKVPYSIVELSEGTAYHYRDEVFAIVRKYIDTPVETAFENAYEVQKKAFIATLKQERSIVYKIKRLIKRLLAGLRS